MNESVFSDERFFHLIVEASPAGMVIADGDGKIVLANAQANRIFGYSDHELIGEPVELLIPQAHSREHTSHRARYMAHPEPRPMAAGRDLFASRKDGSEVAVDISLHPIKTDEGLFVLANILDATERRRVARERESRQAIERLALMGQLVGGVAHEIRTPLCVIRNDVYYLQILAEKLGEEGAECIEEINEAVGKAERIVRELLDFTQDPRMGRVAKVSLRDLVDAAIGDVAVPDGIDLVIPKIDSQWSVDVNHEQIERVLANLIRNAIQALNDAGRVEIRVALSQDEVWVDIVDNGPGVPPGDRERVFEPLFTTRPTGTGLGLAVSKRYAQTNRGDLSVSDNPGGGACFRLTLPNHSPVSPREN